MKKKQYIMNNNIDFIPIINNHLNEQQLKEIIIKIYNYLDETTNKWKAAIIKNFNHILENKEYNIFNYDMLDFKQIESLKNKYNLFTQDQLIETACEHTYHVCSHLKGTLHSLIDIQNAEYNKIK